MMIRVALRFCTLILLLLLTVPAAQAQDAPEIKSVKANPPLPRTHPRFDPDETRCTNAATKWEMRVKFSAIPDAASASKTENYKIIDTNNGRFLEVKEAKIAEVAPGVKSPVVLLCLEEDLTVSSKGNMQQYYLQVIKVNFGEASPEKFVNVVAFTGPDEVAPKTELKYEAKEAKNREDASIYATGELSRASGSDFTGSWDIKVKVPVFMSDNGVHTFSPLFETKGSTDPEQDADTLKLGADWDWILHASEVNEGERPGFFENNFMGLTWQNGPKIEAERDFDNINFTLSSKFLFPTKTWMSGGRVVRFSLNPFVGTEVGKNFKSPVVEAEGRGLARLNFGSGLNLTFKLRQKGFLERMGIEGLYERRVLLRPEVGFKEEEDESLTTLRFGTRPRDWAEAKLFFKFSSLFDAYVGYEYGEQPPSYKLVDHRMKMGLIFKTTLKRE